MKKFLNSKTGSVNKRVLIIIVAIVVAAAIIIPVVANSNSMKVEEEPIEVSLQSSVEELTEEEYEALREEAQQVEGESVIVEADNSDMIDVSKDYSPDQNEDLLGKNVVLYATVASAPVETQGLISFLVENSDGELLGVSMVDTVAADMEINVLDEVEIMGIATWEMQMTDDEENVHNVLVVNASSIYLM